MSFTAFFFFPWKGLPFHFQRHNFIFFAISWWVLPKTEYDLVFFYKLRQSVQPKIWLVLRFSPRTTAVTDNEETFLSWRETIKYHTLILTSVTGKPFMEPNWKQGHKCQPCSEFTFCPLQYNATDSQRFSYTFTGTTKCPAVYLVQKCHCIWPHFHLRQTPGCRLILFSSVQFRLLHIKITVETKTF